MGDEDFSEMLVNQETIFHFGESIWFLINIYLIPCINFHALERLRDVMLMNILQGNIIDTLVIKIKQGPHFNWKTNLKIYTKWRFFKYEIE